MLGSRFFVSGLILTCLFGVGHLTGFIQAVRAARHDPDLVDLTRAMKEHKTSLLGFHPSIMDFREYFSLNFSILLWLAGALGFAALRLTVDPSATIRTFSGIYVVGMLVLLGTSLRFSVVQGIITCSSIAILFGLAWWFA